MFRGQKGITLVALVITIIVLLILAGVTIAALSGDNGILTNASKSQQENALGNAKDLIAMTINEATNDYYSYTYLNETALGSATPAVAEGDKQQTAINYINAIPDPSDSTITIVTDKNSNKCVQIATDDNNKKYVYSVINTNGGLDGWKDGQVPTT